MIKEAIEKILSLAPPTTIMSDYYSTVKLFPILEPRPEPLNVHTLSSVVDYVQKILGAEIDPVHNGMFLSIISPDTVVVESELFGYHQQRIVFLRASLAHNDYPYDKFIPLEDFIVRVQAHFVQDDMTAAILRVVGNITDNNSVQIQDDGVTQQVTAKTGIARVASVPLPNPVTLSPYRTFTEILQVPSKFVLRIKSNQSGIGCALFDADGGMWQSLAVERIYAFLQHRLPDTRILR